MWTYLVIQIVFSYTCQAKKRGFPIIKRLKIKMLIKSLIKIIADKIVYIYLIYNW